MNLEIKHLKKGGIVTEIDLYSDTSKHLMYDMLDGHGLDKCILLKDPEIAHVRYSVCARRGEVLIFNISFRYLSANRKTRTVNSMGSPSVLIEADDPIITAKKGWDILRANGAYYQNSYAKDHIDLTEELKNRVVWEFEQEIFFGKKNQNWIYL